MLMRIGLFTTPWERMLMLVVLVVTVRVGMLKRLACVHVLVPLSKVQPYADAHRARCADSTVQVVLTAVVSRPIPERPGAAGPPA